jgi:hypothetical protein
MTLRTGLIISGDTDGAQKAVADLAAGMDRASTSAEGLASSERVAEAASAGLEKELRQTLTTVGALENDVKGARAALAGLSGGTGALEGQIGRMGAAGRAGTKSMGEMAMGARSMGQQFQDVAVMASLSGGSVTDYARIFTSQIGQMALAAEQMGAKGALGASAAFMNTPWGAAVSGAAIVMVPFIAKMLEGGDAAEFTADGLDKAAESADSFGNAESLLGKIIDLTTGKLKTHNSVLIETIKLQAQLNLVEAQKKINEASGYSTSYEKKSGEYVAGPDGGMGGYSGDFQEQFDRFKGNDRLKNVTDQLYTALGRVVNDAEMANRSPSAYAALVNGQLEQSIGALDRMAQTTKFTAKNLADAKLRLIEFANAGTDKAAALMAISVGGGGPVPDDLKPYARDKKPKKPKKPKSTAGRDEFGRDAADRIASIAESFSETPDAIQKADKAVRTLDDLIEDLGRKKPPNFNELIESAQRAKTVVETGLVRALVEGFKAPETAADKATKALGELDKLLDAQAEKLKGGQIGQAAFDAFKGQIDQSRAVIQEGLNRPYEQFIKSQEDSLRVQALVSQGRTAEAEALRTILQLEKDRAPLDEAHRTAILASVQALQAEQRAADVLRDKRQKDLDALHSIKDAVMDASQAFVRGDLGQFIKTPKKLLDAFLSLQGEKLFEKLFGDMFRDLEDEVNGTSVVKDASARMAEAVDRASKSIASLGSAADQAAASMNGTVPTGVTAGLSGAGSALGAMVGGGSDEGKIVVNGKAKSELDVFSRSIGGAVEKFADIFTNPENAKALGKTIGTFAGKGLEGAATGTMVAGISNALGIKMNSTGAQVGGAIGSFIPIPGGEIIGSIAGGLIGNMFTKPSYGTATLGNVNDSASLAGRAGGEIAAGGAAEQVQSGLANIAKQLGGSLGNFATSIGTFDGKWRVSTTGFSGQLDSKTAKNQGLHDFGKDGEDAAVAFAIRDAIADGAIKGLSPAIQKAIGKYSDIDKSLEEAMKVADVEQLLGGLPAEMAKAFKDFESEAADRLRIAREYGFDIVKTEEINAKQRAALSKQLLDQQVGSLQKLIDEMTSGSMFEGTLVDQRAALLASIEQTKADLGNGVEGAADKLADLLGQLNTVSKDVYGTTGGFATDRSEIVDQARAAIAQANAQIVAAQAQAGSSDPALATTNAALDENNDQNARILALLGDIKALFGQGGATYDDLLGLRAQARTS